jgi:hypothetical protein
MVSPIAGLPPPRRRLSIALDVRGARLHHADHGGGAVGEHLAAH